MAILSPVKEQREHDKFQLNSKSLTAVRVITDGSVSIEPNSSATTINVFNEVTAIASATPTVIASYAALGDFYLNMVEVGGENIADYRVKKNGNTIALVRTHHGTGLTRTVTFTASDFGLKFIIGDSLTVEVEHNRPWVSSHEARIVGVSI